MKKVLAVIFLALAAITISCTIKMYEPMQSDLSYSQKHWADEDLSKLHKGKNYYESYCTKCHGMKNLTKVSEQELSNDIMPAMKKKAKIADTTSDVILRYLLTARNGLLQAKK